MIIEIPDVYLTGGNSNELIFGQGVTINSIPVHLLSYGCTRPTVSSMNLDRWDSLRFDPAVNSCKLKFELELPYDIVTMLRPPLTPTPTVIDPPAPEPERRITLEDL